MLRRIWFTATAAVLVAFGACSNAPEENLVDPCESAYAGLCGQACVATEECPTGLYCSDNTCTADCTPDGDECPDGNGCTEFGACIDDFDLPDMSSGGSGGGASGSTDGCTDIDLPFDDTTPTVLLLVDQSGSMNEEFGASTRWSVLYDALMNQDDGVVWTLEDRVRFGLSLYSSDGGNEGGECPILENVPIALDNYDAIDDVYGDADPRADTPTAESIEAATATLEAFDEPGPKYILLVTDGLPDSCEDADSHDAETQQASVAAAAAAHAAGITLITMGLSDDIATQGAGPGHLQDLANAGSGVSEGAADAPYYVASDDPDELSGQFQTIVGNIRTCVFDLAGSITRADEGRVILDGEQLVLDDPNGWRLNNPRQLEVLGEACDAIKSSASRISITFPCDSDAVDPDIR